MTTSIPREASISGTRDDAGLVGSAPRFDDPANAYRCALVRPVARVLAGTTVTPNLVSVTHPFLAAAAGYYLTFGDWRHLALAAGLMEVRALLDRLDGALAREQGTSSEAGRAVDKICDAAGAVLILLGAFVHFQLHPPTGALAGVPVVVAVALAMSAALRSFFADDTGLIGRIANRSVLLTVITLGLLANQAWPALLLVAAVGAVSTVAAIARRRSHGRAVASG